MERLLSNVGRVSIVLLTAAGMVAGVWRWLMPRGFPIEHPRFWTNTVGPAAIMCLVVAGFVAHFRGRLEITATLAWFVAVVACSTAVAAYAIFFDLIPRVAVFGLVVGVGAVAAAYLGAARPRPHIAMLAFTAPAIACGCFMAWAMRAEIPSTQPLNLEMPDVATLNAEPVEPAYKLTPRTNVFPIAGSVAVDFVGGRVTLEPLLTFQSVSQSGGWTIFSLQGPERTTRFSRLPRVVVPGDRERLFFGDNATLRVTDREAVEIEAFADPQSFVYSHLNSFCVLTIQTEARIQLEFSPCGEARFAPEYADYPVGRPARFAYCDAARTFRVVEATSGEKGPFKELGSGSLAKKDRLTIGVVVGDRLAAKIHFDDWAAQLSTALSPTAGWGVAANAIEFQRAPVDSDNIEHDRRDLVIIWMTLAGTSVGRGWDTVGHQSGTYRNRILIEPLAASQTSPP